MGNINWEKFGEEISKTVQDAVENQNYDRLSQLIKDKLKYSGYKAYTTDKEKAKHTDSKSPKTSGMQYSNASKGSAVPAAIQKKIPSRTGAVLLGIFGYIFGVFQSLVLVSGTLGCLALRFTGIELIIIMIILLISGALAAGGVFLGVTQFKKTGRIDRLNTYLSVIGQREYCNISELSVNTNVPIKTVIKDIEYMIKKRWLLQGHLDKQKTCLMVTDKMYSQYCQLEQQKEIEQKAAKEREEKQKKLQEEQIAAGKMLPPEVQKVIEKGDEYIKKIRACNDDIPGQEISAKIYRIEMLVDKIFDRVEQNPKSVSDIQKLMDYYLPTTVKLLEAYAEMDAQPTAGENIEAAKKEIEVTLDTLNVAFEKLLDGLFQEKAWDVSSDISVLNTMLAQEGLKEDGLKRK